MEFSWLLSLAYSLNLRQILQRFPLSTQYIPKMRLSYAKTLVLITLHTTFSLSISQHSLQIQLMLLHCVWTYHKLSTKIMTNLPTYSSNTLFINLWTLQGICESIRHRQKLIMSMSCSERRLWYIALMHSELIIPRLQIHLRSILSKGYLFFNRHLIQFTMVETPSPRALFLLCN